MAVICPTPKAVFSAMLLENTEASRGIHITLRAHCGTQHERILNVPVLVDENEMIGAAVFTANFQDFLFGRP